MFGRMIVCLYVCPLDFSHTVQLRAFHFGILSFLMWLSENGFQILDDYFLLSYCPFHYSFWFISKSVDQRTLFLICLFVMFCSLFMFSFILNYQYHFAIISCSISFITEQLHLCQWRNNVRSLFGERQTGKEQEKFKKKLGFFFFPLIWKHI